MCILMFISVGITGINDFVPMKEIRSHYAYPVLLVCSINIVSFVLRKRDI